MSRYALDKALWQYAREPDFRVAFDADAGAAIGGWDLDEGERAALEAADIRAVFQLGGHPFLIYSFAIGRNGGWSFEMMRDYVERLKGLELVDIET